MLSDFDNWGDDEILNQWQPNDTTITEARKKEFIENWPTRNKMLLLYLATFTNPYIHQKAEQFYAYKKSQTNLATPLPDAPMVSRQDPDDRLLGHGVRPLPCSHPEQQGQACRDS